MSVKDAQECLGAASFLIPLISDHSSRTLTLILAFSPQGRRDLSLRWNDGGGSTPGPIWPCLASFTPSGEAGNGATVASFGTPLTRTRWASWPWLASLRVARSGETFNSVAFGCISLLSCRLRGPGFHPHPSLLPSREKGSDRLHGNDGGAGAETGTKGRWRHRRD